MSASLKALKHAGISAVVPLFIDDELDHSALPADWEGDPKGALAATGLFNDLPPESQAHIVAQLVLHRLSPGQEVVREGAEGASMFMIAEGAVAVSVQQGESALRVATLTSGDFFGELCLLTGEPRSATVRALTSGLCFELHREAVAEVLAARPELAQTLSEALERRLSSTSERRDEHERSLSVSERQEDVLLSRLKRLFRLTL
jgi:CRP-like cAMP-binding protein